MFHVEQINFKNGFKKRDKGNSGLSKDRNQF